jgi:dienelactone hydrolase
MYYGMPEQDLTKLAMLKASVLGNFAKKDMKITPAIVEKFEQNLKDLNIPSDIKEYDGPWRLIHRTRNTTPSLKINERT